MKWIGLTGGVGSGKSTAARLWKDLGVPVMDADQIAKAVVAPGTDAWTQVKAHFGADVLFEDGSLKRSALAEIVFRDPAELRWLEGLTHPCVRRWVAQEREMWESRGFPMCLYDVPLLYEKKLEREFDKVVVVDAPLELRQKRVFLRSGMSEVDFKRREGIQIPLEEKVKRADFVIRNTQDLAFLKDQIRNITSQILRL